MARSKAKKPKPVRQTAPPPPRATRRTISDTTLMKMLDDHMQESLSDIAMLYQKLAGQLGYRAMQFKEHVRVQSSVSLVDKALDTVSAISGWRKICDAAGFDSRVPMLVITDGATVSTIMRAYRLTRDCVRVHLRACLSVWSLWRKRCGRREVNIQAQLVRACCKEGKMLRTVKRQQIPA